MNVDERVTLEVGKFTYGDPYVKSWGLQRNLKIGAFCSIAGGVTIYLAGSHGIKTVSTFPFMILCPEWQSLPENIAEEPNLIPETFNNEDVEIGNDVWIGDGVSIMTGSVIGDGCVLGAYSVVRGIIPPYSVVAGNPGTVMRKRFTDDQIEALLKIRWWDWPDEKIANNASLLMSRSIERFIEKHLGGME
jgi:acetyltransferase-like isoleucine patch superfamily enzyme